MSSSMPKTMRKRTQRSRSGVVVFEGLPQSAWSFLAINVVFITILLSVTISEILKTYLEFKKEFHRILLNLERLAKDSIREMYKEDARLLLTSIEYLRNPKKFQATIDEMEKELLETMEK